MSGINRMTLLGRAAKDPELRASASGSAVTNFTIVTSYTPKGGEERPEFHRCVAFGRLAEIVSTYIKKGEQLYIEGRLQTRSYEKDGVTKYSTEIVADKLEMLGSKADRSAGGNVAVPTPTTAPGELTPGFDDGEIPF